MPTKPPTTINHDLPVIPELDSEYDNEWGYILNHGEFKDGSDAGTPGLLDPLEERVPVVDTEANRSNYTAHTDALYVSSDSGRVSIGDGSSWSAQSFGDSSSRVPSTSHFEDINVINSVAETTLTQGTNPSESISESTSPKSFNFSGSTDRDIHDYADVTTSNSSGASATEDITVELYDGSDTTGTLVTSETKSVSLNDGASTTTTFIDTDKELDTGTYHIEVTQSGTDLTIDETVEYTKGATYELGQTGVGDLYLRNQDGSDILVSDAVDESIDVNDIEDTGTTVWDSDNGRIGQDVVDSVSIDSSIAPTWSNGHTWNTGAGANLSVDETGLQFNTSNAETLNVQNSGTGGVTLQGDGTEVVKDSRSLTGGNAIDSLGNLSSDRTVAVSTDGIGTNELDLSISPTWAGSHTFDASVSITGGELKLSDAEELQPISTPSSPTSGWKLFTDTNDGDKLKAIDSGGNVTTIAS